jgi:putative MFS transporter
VQPVKNGISTSYPLKRTTALSELKTTMPGLTPVKVRMTYTEFLDNSPMTGFLWTLLAGVLLASLLGGMDFMVTSFALPGIIREFKLNPAMAGAIFSAGNIGMALGAIFFPLLSDRIGRRPIFQWVLIIFAAGSFLSAIASSFQMMLGARFITGVGLGAEIPIVLAVLAEYAPLRLRHIFIPLVSVFAAIGFIVAALLSIWLIPAFGWRSVFWAGIAPALLITFIRRYTPESIRFLLSRGRTEEAGRIANDIAGGAQFGNVELVPPVMEKSQPKLSLGGQLALLRPIWLPTLLLAIFYFCSFIQIFGVNAWLPTIFVRQGFKLTASFGYTLMIYSVAPFSHVVAMWLMAKVSRRWALFIMPAGGTIFFILFGLSFEYKWPVPVLVGSQILQVLLAQGVVSVLFTFSSEIFPTPVRSLGLGLVTGVGRFGAVLGPFVVGLALLWGARISQVIYVFATPLFVIAVITLLVVKIDTRQKTLDHISDAT